MLKDGQGDAPAHFKYIERNEFVHRKHIKQKKEDVPICNCEYSVDDPGSACGVTCLNVLTNTECTPGFCPCGDHCKNQRFQKCQYVKSKLFKTNSHGWGLLAEEDLKAGQFVIEYCGEVITWKEAERRAEVYEREGMKDAFIISLDASELVDATKKGSLARFINHSCEPNCVTRKWTVLGEIRVGIFAKKNIPAGTELSYDYNFQWFGGAKVRCLCGTASCTGFLGAKSRGFQEDTYLWEDDDGRFSIENVPLYDSEEDVPNSKLLKHMDLSKDSSLANGKQDGSTEDDMMDEDIKLEEDEDEKVQSRDSQVFSDKSVPSRIDGRNISHDHQVEATFNRRSQSNLGGRSKHPVQKQVNVKLISQLLPSKEAQEILALEEARNLAKTQLDSLYDEIRPAIEEHEKDSQDSVSTNVAEKWIGSCCAELKAEFDLHFAIIKNVASSQGKLPQEDARLKVEGHEHLLNFTAAGASEKFPPAARGFGIGCERLAALTREHDTSSFQEHGRVEGLAKLLKTDLDKGIPGDDSETLVLRREAFGSNTCPRKKGKSFSVFLWEASQDKTLIALMIGLIAVALPLGFGIKGIKEGWYDGASIAFVVLLVVLVTASSDYKQSLQFQGMNEEKRNIKLKVVRSGARLEISIFDLIVGDVVPLKIGDQVRTLPIVKGVLGRDGTQWKILPWSGHTSYLAMRTIKPPRSSPSFIPASLSLVAFL